MKRHTVKTIPGFSITAVPGDPDAGTTAFSIVHPPRQADWDTNVFQNETGFTLTSPTRKTTIAVIWSAPEVYPDGREMVGLVVCVTRPKHGSHVPYWSTRVLAQELPRVVCEKLAEAMI